MKLNKLTIQGFKSFNQAQTFEFDKLEQGLHFLTGRNGAGKSALFDGVCWILYGKDSNDLKAGNIKSWNSRKQCFGSLEFEQDNFLHTIKRVWNPNSLTLDGRVVEQQTIDGFVGLGYSAFLYSVLISQFSAKFFDLQPVEKLEIFSDIVDADKWLEYSNVANEKQRKLVERLSQCDIDVAKKTGQRESLESQDYEESIQRWKKENKENIRCLKEEVRVLLEGFGEASEKLIKSNKDILKYKKEWSISQQHLNGLLQEKDKLVEEKSHIFSKLSVLESSGTRLTGDLNKFIKVKEQCPYCLQKVSKSHIEKEKTRLQKEIGKVKVEHDEWRVKKHKLEDTHKELDDKLKDKESKQDKAQIVINQIENTIISLDKDIEVTEQYVEAKKVQYKKLEGTENPYLKLKQENKGKIEVLKQGIQELEERILATQRVCELYKYWVKGFKDIRLYVVSEALRDFEIYINNNLQKFEMVDWEVQLTIDTETKSNTIKKGFTVKVKSPTNKELVPFKCWSGGEGQRIRLAGTAALIDLIHDRKGVDWDVEVYDEPTTWLEPEGVDSLLEILLQRAKEARKKVILIDHRDLHTFGGFKSIIEVVKDNNSSRLKHEA